MSIKRRITNYLCSGGLFNPELMEHDKVRALLIDARDYIETLESKVKDQCVIAELIDKNFSFKYKTKPDETNGPVTRDQLAKFASEIVHECNSVLMDGTERGYDYMKKIDKHLYSMDIK